MTSTHVKWFGSVTPQHALFFLPFSHPGQPRIKNSLNFNERVEGPNLWKHSCHKHFWLQKIEILSRSNGQIFFLYTIIDYDYVLTKIYSIHLFGMQFQENQSPFSINEWQSDCFVQFWPLVVSYARPVNRELSMSCESIAANMLKR